MIHPADECPQIPEHSFDLGGQFELPSFVDICSVLHWPPGIDAFVDTPSIRLQLAAWFHELIEELASLRLAHRFPWEDAKGNLCRPDLLRHHERDVLEVRFIHLHRASEDGFQLR